MKNSCYDLTRCIKVKIQNEIQLSHILCQEKVIAYIGPNLTTLYQTFEEIIRVISIDRLLPLFLTPMTLQIPGYKVTKKVLIKNIGKGFEMTKETIENDEVEHLTKFISKSAMKGYISEGASVLLHRLLIARGIPDNFSVIVFNQYWELSFATYVIDYRFL